MIGCSPDPFTFGELVVMAQGKRKADWQIASAQMALLANINRDKKKRTKPYSPSDFDPFTPLVGSSGVPLNRDNMQMLRAAFVGGKL